MRRLLLALLLLCAATGAEACTCAAPTAEAQRLDARVAAADRVVLVRVTGARLRPRELNEREQPWPLQLADQDVVYELETVEVLKGSTRALSLPVLESDASDCAQALAPGEFVLLYLRTGDGTMQSNRCRQHKAQRLGYWSGDAELIVAAIRELVRDGTAPHACEGTPEPPDALRAECDRRRREAQARWIERVRVKETP